MNGKLLNEGYKPAPRPGLAQNGYQAQPSSTRPAAPPTPPKATSSVVKPKD
jgi:hypothetical protein